MRTSSLPKSLAGVAGCRAARAHLHAAWLGLVLRGCAGMQRRDRIGNGGIACRRSPSAAESNETKHYTTKISNRRCAYLLRRRIAGRAETPTGGGWVPLPAALPRALSWRAEGVHAPIAEGRGGTGTGSRRPRLYHTRHAAGIAMGCWRPSWVAICVARKPPPPVHVTGKGEWKGGIAQRDGRRGYMRWCGLGLVWVDLWVGKRPIDNSSRK